MDTNGGHAGSFMVNGGATEADEELTDAGLNKNELVRLLVQAMDGLGYTSAARELEGESGIAALSPNMRRLRECVLSGEWSEVESVFEAASGSCTGDGDWAAARFVVYEQQFLELLDAGKVSDALLCLRGSLARCSKEASALHKLPLLCMCSSPEEVRERANWAGTGIQTRTEVLHKLQSYIPASQLLAENRLQTLLQQAVRGQKQRAIYPYTRQTRVSLLEDLEHCPDRVPRKPMFRLAGHGNEVWFVQFSHNGRYLASASKDTSVIIWDWAGLKSGTVDESSAIRYRLEGHSHVICLISWSPDDTHLLSCGRDKSVRLWNVSSGECLRVFTQHDEQVTSCAWMSHGRSFVSGAMDRRIYEWDAWSGSNAPTGSYAPSARVNDMAVTGDGKRLVVICTDNHIQVFDTATRRELARMVESPSITSLSLSFDGRFLLVNTSANDVERPEIHMWDLLEGRMCKKFKGFKQKRYVIRACFGGYDQMLVLCGSEDNSVYMWQRHDGNVLARLEGHSATVNSVAWCSSDPNVFASGSDDSTVIVWGAGTHDSRS
jgi:WD repeat-containing protein 26